MTKVVIVGEAYYGDRYPDIAPPGPQPPNVGVWPNPPEGQAPIPTHPIALPPDLPPTMPPPDSRPIEWKAAWTPTSGWIVIGIPTGPVPTPST